MLLFFGTAAASVGYQLLDLSEAVRSAGRVVATALFVTFASAVLMIAVTSTISAIKKADRNRLKPKMKTSPLGSAAD
jgi:hypothetical protein